MKVKLIIFKALLLSSLALNTPSASARPFDFLGYFQANRVFGGSDYTIMTNANSSYCFLSIVGMDGNGGGQELTACAVYVSNGFWWLQAYVQEGANSQALCRAYCISDR